MQHPLIATLMAAFANIIDKFKPINYPKAGAPRARWNQPTPSHGGGSGKTRRGAKHKAGKTFKSKSLLRVKIDGVYKVVTPALYRQLHLGKSKVVPNYIKPHSSPRGRNVVKGTVNGS